MVDIPILGFTDVSFLGLPESSEKAEVKRLRKRFYVLKRSSHSSGWHCRSAMAVVLWFIFQFNLLLPPFLRPLKKEVYHLEHENK